MAIDRKLRGCDLVKLKGVDVMASGQIKECASVLRSNIQKPVSLKISEGIQASVENVVEDELMVDPELSCSLMGRALLPFEQTRHSSHLPDQNF